MSATLQQAPPAPRPHRRFGFLVQPGWLAAIVGALAFTAACWLVLAPWQFDRNTETSRTNAGIDAAVHATPVSVDRHLSVTGEPDEQSVWQPVTATGTFLPDRQFYVRLRQDDAGNPVSEVVLPMRLTDGTVLLVDRGTRSTMDIGQGIALPPVPAGVVTVTGRVQQDQTDPLHRPPGLLNGLNQAYAVNADDLAGPATTPGNVRQGYLQLMAGSPGVLTAIGMPQTDAGPYLSYALQWCAFGAMSLLAMGYFIFREATDPRGADDRHVPYPVRGRLDDDPRVDDALGDPVSNPAGSHPAGGAVESGGPAADPHLPEPAAAGTAAGRATTTTTRTATRTATRTPPRKRRSRDGFDRSDLFD